MNAFMKTALRDPLAHFLVVGLMFYGGTQYTQTEQQHKPITISAEHQETMAEHFSHAFLYPPKPEELAKLVEQSVADEVLYREGLRYGLDQDDPVVRKRLIQKMNFMLEGAATPPVPSQAELSAFFEANLERYRQAEKITFQHVFFDKQRRQAATAEDAVATLKSLKSATVNESSVAGDPFIRGNNFTQLNAEQIDRIMGAGFTDQMKQAIPQEWYGPINSPYGAHLIKIASHVPATTPALLLVRERVYADWKQTETEKLKDAALRKLVAQYPVAIEKFDVTAHLQPQVTLNQYGKP